MLVDLLIVQVVDGPHGRDIVNFQSCRSNDVCSVWLTNRVVDTAADLVVESRVGDVHCAYRHRSQIVKRLQGRRGVFLRAIVEEYPRNYGLFPSKLPCMRHSFHA